jgi:hypothetical protein
VQGMLSAVKLVDKKRWWPVLAVSTTPHLAVRKSSDPQAMDYENFDGVLSARASLLRKSSDMTLVMPHIAHGMTNRLVVCSGEVRDSCICLLRNFKDLVRYIGN